MPQFLTHTPWWFTVIVLLSGAIALFLDNRTNAKHLGEVGLIVFALGILLGAGYFLSDTDPERMETRTRQIVADIDLQNWTGLQGLLDSQTVLDFGGQAPAGLANVKGADKIAPFMQSEAKQIGLKRAVLTGTRIEQNGDSIVVAFNIASWQQASSDPAVTSWQFNWRLNGGKWILDTIKPLDLPVPGTARELIGLMRGDTSRHDPDGSIVLQGNERITTPQRFSPPVDFLIVAQTDSTNIRIAYAADQIIFNWEINPDQMRIDGGPANGRHTDGAGRIPVKQWVTIELTVLPDSMRILTDGKQRFFTNADFSQVNQSLTIFPQNGSTIKVKSVTESTP